MSLGYEGHVAVNGKREIHANDVSPILDDLYVLAETCFAISGAVSERNLCSNKAHFFRQVGSIEAFSIFKD